MRTIVLLLALTAVAFAVQVPEQWVRVPYADPNPLEKTRVIIGLKQENLDELESIFWDISSTRSANYGKYMSQDEIGAIIAPTSVHIDAVIAHLAEHGVHRSDIDIVQTRDVLFVRTEVKHIESAFGVELLAFQHTSSARVIYRSLSAPSLPSHVSRHIDIVHDIHDFPPMKVKNSKPSRTMSDSSPASVTGVNARSQSAGASLVISLAIESSIQGNDLYVIANSTNPNIPASYSQKVSASDCNGSVCSVTLEVDFYIPLSVGCSYTFNGSPTFNIYDWPTVVTPHVSPKMLYDLYGIPSSPRVTHSEATQCVVEFEQQYYSPDDLEQYFAAFAVPASNDDVVVVGTNDISNPGAEANLDIQWIMGMAPGAETWFWSVYANSTVEIDHILTWCYQVGNSTEQPLVNSLSYGMTEHNVDRFLGDGYLARTDTELQKLAMQGLTIIIADGDTGANDLGAPPMSQVKCFPSHADWPSDSQYVTSIGSTFMTPLVDPICYLAGGMDCLQNPVGEAGVSVAAGMTWTTGGGFSNYTSRPSYQDAAVENYLAVAGDSLPPSGYFNSEGRAYADAVTVGHNLECVVGGNLVAIDGTSASAPIFAGIVTLLNDARLNAGKTPLGFITQAMYEIAQDAPQCWNDIGVGANNCGSVGWLPVCCEDGYEATPGWDPVSGLGSPNFQCLRDYFVSLP